MNCTSVLDWQHDGPAVGALRRISMRWWAKHPKGSLALRPLLGCQTRSFDSRSVSSYMSLSPCCGNTFQLLEVLQSAHTGSMLILACRSYHAFCRKLELACSAGRHLYAIVTGFALIYYPFGAGCFHALVPSTLTYFVLRSFRPQAARLAWLINFTYLIGW